MLRGKRVLIVDDEPDVLETLKDLLEMSEISTATSFEEAKMLLQTQHFDLAVFDIMGVDGFKLLEIANERKILTVMLTAHALSLENTVKSFKKGAAYFIPKEEMANIAIFLNDVLEGERGEKSFWRKWLDRLGEFYDKRFGSDWMKQDRDFWDEIKQK